MSFNSPLAPDTTFFRGLSSFQRKRSKVTVEQPKAEWVPGERDHGIRKPNVVTGDNGGTVFLPVSSHLGTSS